MNRRELQSFFRSHHAELVGQVVADASAHLRSIDGDLFGYALNAGDVYEQESLFSCYLLQEEASSDNDSEAFLKRHIPDEWPHFCHEAFAASSQYLSELKAEFLQRHPQRPEDFTMDKVELEYAGLVYEALDDAIAELRKGSLGSEPFATLWISQSFNMEHVMQSIARHNGPILTMELKKLLQG